MSTVKEIRADRAAKTETATAPVVTVKKGDLPKLTNIIIKNLHLKTIADLDNLEKEYQIPSAVKENLKAACNATPELKAEADKRYTKQNRAPRKPAASPVEIKIFTLEELKDLIESILDAKKIDKKAVVDAIDAAIEQIAKIDKRAALAEMLKGYTKEEVEGILSENK